MAILIQAENLFNFFSIYFQRPLIKVLIASVTFLDVRTGYSQNKLRYVTVKILKNF